MAHLLYTQRNNPQYSLKRRLDGTQSQSECFRPEKNPLPFLGIEAWTVQHVA
jgi:hypothetical protein